MADWDDELQPAAIWAGDRQEAKSKARELVEELTRQSRQRFPNPMLPALCRFREGLVSGDRRALDLPFVTAKTRCHQKAQAMNAFVHGRLRQSMCSVVTKHDVLITSPYIWDLVFLANIKKRSNDSKGSPDISDRGPFVSQKFVVESSIVVNIRMTEIAWNQKFDVRRRKWIIVRELQLKFKDEALIY